MKKVLIVAYYYKDAINATGIVERSFLSTKMKDIEFHIVCADGPISLDTNYQITVVKINKFLLYFAKAINHTPLKFLCSCPDAARICWYSTALKEIKKLCFSHRYDFIHTICHPFSAHIIGYKIKKQFNIKWIAQFYDPWTNNPTHNRSNKYIKQCEDKYEFLVAKYADLILHTNQIMINYWKKRYGNLIEEKCKILPLVMAQSMPISNTQSKMGYLNISHIGNFASYRTAIPFIEAINHFITNHKEYRENIKINFIGSVTNEEKSLIASYGLSDIFLLKGRLSEKDCEKYFRATDIFLAIDTLHEDNPFFPSKILNYYLYNRPILGITATKSVLKEEMLASGNYAFHFDDIEGISNFLLRAITNYNSILTQVKNYSYKFSIESVQHEYLSLLNKL